MTDKLFYWVTGINPEPWSAGTPYRRGSRGLGIAKDGKLRAYQEALGEEFLQQNAHAVVQEGELSVTFYFWRSSAFGNQADATNLQKATEDALQGFLYPNDRTNRDVRSVIMEQGPEVDPHILIVVEPFVRERLVIVPPETALAPKWAGSDWEPPQEEMF